MKKIVTILLTVSILIPCFSVITYAEKHTANNKPYTFAGENTLPKVRYYYTNDYDDVVMSDSAQVFNENINPEEQIEVVFELEYDEEGCNCKDIINADSSDAEVDVIKIAHRNHMKEALTKFNADFLFDSGLSITSDECTIVTSNYSPFVQMVFDSYNDYQDYDAQIVALADSDNVSGINIGVPITNNTDATRADTSSAAYYQMANAIEDINASDQTYNGAGVTVGIIEAEGVAYSNSDPELETLTIHTVGTLSNEHAINVTRVFCGSQGLARNVDEVYIYHSSSSSTMIDAMDWMIENDVDVINISKSSPNIYGQYHWTSALLDYYVRYEYITCVASSGNNGTAADHGTSNYAMGYNVIAVGATDAANNISTYSAYGVDSGIYSGKPTISAPGTRIVIGGEHIGSGTSFSAPIVAGVIAKLMDEYDFLKMFPEVVIACLIASASHVNGQGTNWDTHAGAGRVNYEKAREAVENHVSFEFSDDAVGSIRISERITGVANKKIRVAAFWLVNSVTLNSFSQILVNNQTDYDLIIADMDGERIIGSFNVKNIERVGCTCGNNNILILQIEQYEARKTSDEDWGAFTWVYQ